MKITSIGDRIAQRRRERGLNQAELAELIDTSQRQVSKYETGINIPSGEVLGRIADALDVSADWLIGRISADGLTDTERELIRAVRQLPEDKQDRVRKMLEIIR
jgi:transcriptional regulator with XRE-family HTH domain